MLVHDKEFAGADYEARMPAIDRAIALYGEVPRMTLFRGLPPGRGNGTFSGGVISFRGYASFSESLASAARFAEETRAVVALDATIRAFPYSKWLESEFRSMEPEEYEMADGDYMIETAHEEAEWIFPFASWFKAGVTREEAGLKIVSAT